MHQARTMGAIPTVPSSFKDLIESKAEENNIVFLPIPNRTHEAKQVYKFGNCNIVIDRGVIFVQEGQLWIPISIQALVIRAK